MAENGKYVGEKGTGRYIKQKAYALPYDRYVPRKK